MKRTICFHRPFWLVPFALLVLAGCSSTDEGGHSTSTSVYYGTGFYDPWYYGDYHYHHDADIIVSPPPAGNRPDFGPRPEHPIARPPGMGERPIAGPRPEPPMARPPAGAGFHPSTRPSIPSTPRPRPSPRR